MLRDVTEFDHLVRQLGEARASRSLKRSTGWIEAVRTGSRQLPIWALVLLRRLRAEALHPVPGA